MSQKVIQIYKEPSETDLSETFKKIQDLFNSKQLKNMLIVYEDEAGKIKYHMNTEDDPIRVLGFLQHVSISIHSNEFYVA